MSSRDCKNDELTLLSVIFSDLGLLLFVPEEVLLPLVVSLLISLMFRIFHEAFAPSLVRTLEVLRTSYDKKTDMIKKIHMYIYKVKSVKAHRHFFLAKADI